MAVLESDRKIAAIAARMVGGGLAKSSDFHGCSDEEVARLEAYFGIRFPAIYRAYLSRMGHGAGGVWTGSDFLYPDLFRFKEVADDILKANGQPFALLPSDFVFLMHQDYQFAWFPTGGANDPPVYAYTEVDGRPPQTTPQVLSESFSEWLMSAVEDHIAIRARNPQFFGREPHHEPQ